MGGYWTQLFPPYPRFTEANLSSQKGKVFIVTGGASGVGFQLVSILFRAGAKVYIAGRSEEKAKVAIEEITASSTGAVGHLEFLSLQLDDLTTIRASVEHFRARESRVHALWNNAGVAVPPAKAISKQGHELQLATNCLGPYLFTKLLIPELKAAAEAAPVDSVRVIWTSSMLVDTMVPKDGMRISELSPPQFTSQEENYAISKLGNWFLASELARQVGHAGIISIVQNPGNLKTEVWRHTNKWLLWLVSWLLHDAKLGAYTELWAGLSPRVTAANNGGYVVPWGRWHTAPRADLLIALKREEDGGNGQAGEFWEWCEEHTKQFQ